MMKVPIAFAVLNIQIKISYSKFQISFCFKIGQFTKNLNAFVKLKITLVKILEIKKIERYNDVYQKRR